MVPLVYLVEWQSIIDCIDKHEALGSSYPEMCQIVYIIVTSCIPDCKIKSELTAIFLVNDYCFIEVLNSDCVVVQAYLGPSLQESLYEHGLTYACITHHDYFSCFMYDLFSLRLYGSHVFLYRFFLNLLFIAAWGSKQLPYFLRKALFLLLWIFLFHISINRLLLSIFKILLCLYILLFQSIDFGCFGGFLLLFLLSQFFGFFFDLLLFFFKL